LQNLEAENFYSPDFAEMLLLAVSDKKFNSSLTGKVFTLLKKVKIKFLFFLVKLTSNCAA